MPQTYLSSCRVTEAVSLSPGTESIPSLRVLNEEPLRRGSILLGAIVTMAAVAAFGLVLSRPVIYMPIPGSNGRMSPIESVVQRLNQATAPDSVAGSRQDALASAHKSASAEAGDFDAQSSAMAAASASKPDPAAVTLANKNEPDRFGPMQSQIPQKQTPDLNAVLPGSRQDSRTIAEPNQNSLPPGEPRPENAARAMIQLFHSHDIVMFGEVHNGEQEYKWLCELVKSPGFSDHVDDIVVEFGNALYQKTVDRYIAGEDIPFDDVQPAWRNMVADYEPVSPVYGWLYKAVREANIERQGKPGIRLLMGSPPGDWSKIRNSADLAPYEAEREQWYAQVVKAEVLANHHHALLIMGAGHFLRGHDQALEFELAAQQRHDAPLDKAHLGPGFIERELRGAGANPYLVVFGTDAIDNRGNVDRRFNSWPAPVIVPLAGNWVGSLPAQPVISGGHAPAIPLTLADQADALLYVAPCSVLRRIYLSHAELDGTAYEGEMMRRDIILLGHPLTFAYGALPQCIQPQQASH
jgi:hypothetical protein